MPTNWFEPKNIKYITGNIYLATHMWAPPESQQTWVETT